MQEHQLSTATPRGFAHLDAQCVVDALECCARFVMGAHVYASTPLLPQRWMLPQAPEALLR